MKFMMWHVEYFKGIPVVKGRSNIYDKMEPVSAGNSLLFFIGFEKSDKEKIDEIEGKFIDSVKDLSSRLGVKSVVLNPYAHMFIDLLDPETSIKMLNDISDKLTKEGFEVHKMSFGIFYEIELKAKGHKLSRISRSIN